MANSKLQHKEFPVPDEVLLVLNTNLKKLADRKDSKGFNRALFIVQRRACTYEQLKRIKNYFDHIDPNDPTTFDEVEYLLNGGEIMSKWVNYTLNQARQSVKGTKTARTNAGMTNQFRADSEDGDGVNPVTPTLKKVPEFMTTSELMEEIAKIKEISSKLSLNG